MNRSSEEKINILTGHLFREHYGKMVSYLSQKFGYHQLENIIDAVQESFEAALKSWRFTAIPNQPFAWLYKVANHKLLNKIKREHLSRLHLEQLPVEDVNIDLYSEQEAEDSLFKLLNYFSTANFSERNKLVISLYFLCGFSYSEISNALLLKADTVKKVVRRSKEAIKKFSGAYDDHQIHAIEQPDHMLKIIYLLFNEGYKSSQKNGTINTDLCFEAIRLAKLVNRHCPHYAETNALLAVLFFHSSRFPSRTKDGMANGTWISLENQDRRLWDSNLITTGFHHLRVAKAKQTALGKYYLEALISSLHCRSDRYEDTDWKTISYLYEQLEHLEPHSISVTLNRIIAESNYKDLTPLILKLQSMGTLITNDTAFFYHSIKANFYAKLEHWDLSLENYHLSLAYTKNKTDINFIKEKIAQINPHLISVLTPV